MWRGSGRGRQAHREVPRAAFGRRQSGKVALRDSAAKAWPCPAGIPPSASEVPQSPCRLSASL